MFGGVGREDEGSDAQASPRETHVRHPVGTDNGGGTARGYGLVGIPMTVFIDARGLEVARHTGELTRAALRSMLTERFPER